MKIKLMVVADLGWLKAYRVEMDDRPTPHLALVEEMELTEARQKIKDKLSDLAGRRRSAGMSGAAPMADSHNQELEVEKRLVRQLTDKIVQLASQNCFEGCYLAVGKEINRKVVDALPPRVREKIEVNLALDLTKVEICKLWDYFKPDRK